MKKDGHVHTPYCPHGTTDSLEEYIEQAIQLHIDSITFTEHAPLPNTFHDPTPNQDSAIELETMEEYIEKIQLLKKAYKNEITINLGLEVDYIKEYEEETTSFLNTYGKYLDDSILSVHFLKLQDKYYCMDFDEHTFKHMIDQVESLEKLHHIYYQEVLHSIQSDLGEYKPKRIGHITLVNKFQKLFPVTFSVDQYIQTILFEIKNRGYELDYNVAGLRKEFCGETYPGSAVAKMAQEQKIPLIYGSDAHSARDVGKNYTCYQQLTNGN